jgi:hypothetical protein
MEVLHHQCNYLLTLRNVLFDERLNPSLNQHSDVQEREKARLREEILQKARPTTWAFSYSWESRCINIFQYYINTINQPFLFLFCKKTRYLIS